MPWIDTRPGCAVHFDEDCHTDPWGSPPETVVLIHGMAESAAAWTAWLPHLTRRFRVIRVDLPGFGRSLVDVPTYPWSMASLAEDVLRVLDGLGEARAHIVGAKAGGAVALSLACAAPDRLHSVVALTGPMWATGPDTVVHQKGIGGRVREIGVRDWAAATMPARLGSGVSPEQIRWWVDLMARTRPEVLATTAEGGTALDLRPHLHRIKAPALMITSTGSPLSASAVRDVWHGALPHGRSVVFPDDGYHIAAIQPDACGRIVSAFLCGDEHGYEAAVAAHDGLDVRG
jgi:3-oxoadipate enol-lactonase